ncbi:hypothetical protein [Bradyrhizobium sp.]|jgi:hypothetical protein|uniref:hypothetical protein n=1 Tax=Bradyrhizobium sp. TaxID=376 RepID=UPI002D7F814E|nr:hypothetical protein [Bradyrhizobium sp.]
MGRICSAIFAILVGFCTAADNADEAEAFARRPACRPDAAILSHFFKLRFDISLPVWVIGD